MTGSASVLLAAAVAALAWANLDLSSYESVWRTQLSIQVGGSGISQTLRDWVNSGHQGELRPRDLQAYAEQLGLEIERYREDLRRHEHAPRIEEDVDSADISGVTGTPAP